MADAAGETLTFKMQIKSSVIRTLPDGTKKVIGNVVIGTLDWGKDSYSVRSGPWGKGALPGGTYSVKWPNLVEGHAGASKFSTGMTFNAASELKTSTAVVGKNGTAAKADLTGFFVPIEPDFAETRKGFGIHPDGNVYGTQGCIGLVDGDATKFWKKTLETPGKSRPAKLLVTGTPEAGQEIPVTADAGANE